MSYVEGAPHSLEGPYPHSRTYERISEPVTLAEIEATIAGMDTNDAVTQMLGCGTPSEMQEFANPETAARQAEWFKNQGLTVPIWVCVSHLYHDGGSGPDQYQGLAATAFFPSGDSGQPMHPYLNFVSPGDAGYADKKLFLYTTSAWKIKWHGTYVQGRAGEGAGAGAKPDQALRMAVVAARSQLLSATRHLAVPYENRAWIWAPDSRPAAHLSSAHRFAEPA